MSSSLDILLVSSVIFVNKNSVVGFFSQTTRTFFLLYSLQLKK
jgi:hypothetical protein